MPCWCSSAWLSPGSSCCRRASAGPLRELYLARLVRDSIAEISPFSPVGGMVAAARLLILKGMPGAYAGASVAGDATTEAMAQVVFLAFGLGWGVSQFRHLSGGDVMTEAMLAVLLLAVPGIALLIFLQKKGAAFAERMAARFFPQSAEGVSFHAAIEEMYDSQDAPGGVFGFPSAGLDRRRGRHLDLLPPGRRRHSAS